MLRFFLRMRAAALAAVETARTTTPAPDGSSMPPDAPPEWFCSFDDDQYVIIDQLWALLRRLWSEHGQGSEPLYIGRSSIGAGRKISLYGRTFGFGTGGAGWCVNAAWLQRAQPHIIVETEFQRICAQIGAPDDVTVGFLSSVLATARAPPAATPARPAHACSARNAMHAFCCDVYRWLAWIYWKSRRCIHISNSKI
jgi:hypothetical protein